MARTVMIVSGLMVLGFFQSLRAAGQGPEQSVPRFYAEIQYMQVPQGGEELYLQVEDAWMKIHSARKELGITQASLLCKVKRTDGPAGDYNYTVVHVFDDWAKLENPYEPWDAIQSKFSVSADEKAIFEKTSASRTMLRTELWKAEGGRLPVDIATWSPDAEAFGRTVLRRPQPRQRVFANRSRL